MLCAYYYVVFDRYTYIYLEKKKAIQTPYLHSFYSRSNILQTNVGSVLYFDSLFLHISILSLCINWSMQYINILASAINTQTHNTNTYTFKVNFCASSIIYIFKCAFRLNFIYIVIVSKYSERKVNTCTQLRYMYR